MENRAIYEVVSGKPDDYSKDFTFLTLMEKREVLKTAKTFLKLQKENALLSDTPVLPVEAEKTRVL